MATEITPEEFYLFVKEQKVKETAQALMEGLTWKHFLYQTQNEEEIGNAWNNFIKNGDYGYFLHHAFMMQKLAWKNYGEDNLIYAVHDKNFIDEMTAASELAREIRSKSLSDEIRAQYLSDKAKKQEQTPAKQATPQSREINQTVAQAKVEKQAAAQVKTEEFDEIKLIWDIEESKVKQVQKVVEQGLPFACYAAVDGDGVGILDIAEQTALSLPRRLFERKDAEEIVSLLREGRKEALKKDVLPVLKMAIISLKREDWDEKYRMSLSSRRKLHDFIKIYRTSLLNHKDKSALGVLQKAVMVLSAQACAPKENISAWLESEERKKELQTRIEPYTLNKLKEFVAAYTDEAQQIRLLHQRSKLQSNNMIRKDAACHER